MFCVYRRICAQVHRAWILAARQVPLESILIETDAPYLSPPPHRGKRNDSSNLPFILEKMFSLRTEANHKVEQSIYENSLKFIHRKAV